MVEENANWALLGEMYRHEAQCKQEKIKQYEELLRECKPFVELCNYTAENKKLLEKIDELLGEDK